MIEIESFKKSG